MFIQIFYWLLGIIGGFLTIKYRKNIHDWTGGWYWAEKYLWRWGTHTALILIGLGMIGLGVAAMFGQVELTNQNTIDTSQNIDTQTE